MFTLYDSYFGVPVLIGRYETIEEVREAARKLDENTRGSFHPIIEHNDQILKNWTY